MLIPVESLRRDGGTQPRAAINFDVAYEYGDDMMLSLYFALGIFLLMAVRNPSAHRSLIAFAAWSSFAHGAVMVALAVPLPRERTQLLSAVAVLVLIGVTLIALAPAKDSAQRQTATAA